MKLLLLFASALAAISAEVNLAVIRFQPDDKKLLLASAQTFVGNLPDLKTRKAESILLELQKNGLAAIVFQTTQNIPAGQTNHIETNQTARVVMPGDTQDLPPVTRLALKFDLNAALEGEKLALSWRGSVRWSPQIVDASGQGAIIRRQSGTNITFIRPFAPTGRAVGFEYPILRETAFQSSKTLRDGELSITSTTAETGGAPPEMLLLCIWAYR